MIKYICTSYARNFYSPGKPFKLSYNRVTTPFTIYRYRVLFVSDKNHSAPNDGIMFMMIYLRPKPYRIDKYRDFLVGKKSISKQKGVTRNLIAQIGKDCDKSICENFGGRSFANKLG